MAYEYDVFISYKGDNSTWEWIENHFKPLIEHRLQLELGREPQIFIDKNRILPGTTWSIELCDAMSKSKILIALCTKTYFNSKWCNMELQMMKDRVSENLNESSRPSQLIIPFILHDGEDFNNYIEGRYIQTIQVVDLKKYYVTRMRKDSPLCEELEKIIAEKAEAIANAILNVPEWKANWFESYTENFIRHPDIILSAQETPPRYT